MNVDFEDALGDLIKAHRERGASYDDIMSALECALDICRCEAEDEQDDEEEENQHDEGDEDGERG